MIYYLLKRLIVLLGLGTPTQLERPIICAHCGSRLRLDELDYACKTNLLSGELASKWVQLSCDEDSWAYINKCLNRTMVYRFASGVAAQWLRLLFSRTTANGILGRGGMFVMSTSHARILLDRPADRAAIEDADLEGVPELEGLEGDEDESECVSEKAAAVEGEEAASGADTTTSQVEEKEKEEELQAEGAEVIERGYNSGKQRSGTGVLFDVGAGDGDVTRRLMPLFEKGVVTETSYSMIQRLRASGRYVGVIHSENVTDANEVLKREAAANGGKVDCIALLNVLDRCSRPRTLLYTLKRMLVPETGLLMIAVVLPFRPFVENGVRKDPPEEKLFMNPNAGFEKAATSMYEQVLKPAGFKLERFSRLPYLAEGEHHTPLYVLDDAIFVLSVPKRKSSTPNVTNESLHEG